MLDKERRKQALLGIRTKLLILLFIVGLLPSSVAIFVLYTGAVATTKNALALELLERAQGMMSALDDSLQALSEAAASVADRLQENVSPADALANLPAPIEAAALIEGDESVTHSQSVFPNSVVSLKPLPRAVEEATAAVLADEVSSGTFGPCLRLFLRIAGHRYLVTWTRLARLVEPFGVSMPGDQTQLMLLTNRGNIIARRPPPAPLIQTILTEGLKSPNLLAHWTEIPSDRQPGYLAAFRASSFWRQRQKAGQTSLDWYAVAYTDIQFVIPALNTLLWRLVGLGIVLAVGLAGLSAAVSARFLKPLRLLHKQVEAVRRGEWAAFEEVRTGDELEELERAFGAMLVEIRQSREALEEQVIRTQTRATQVQLVNEISRAILGSFSLRRLLETSETQLANTLPVRSVILVLKGKEGVSILTPNSGAYVPNDLMQLKQALEEQLREAQSGTVLARVKWMVEEQEESAVAMRLATPGQELGFIIMRLVPGAGLTDEHEQFLEQLAPFFSLAIQHINLYEQVSKFAAELEKKVEERAAQLEQAHRQLLQTERLAVTGQLAAGVAHEINNPLGIIKNLLQVLRLAATPSPETIKIIEEEIDRIARIVRGLLDFSRPPAAVGPPAEVAREVRQVLELLQPELRKRHIALDVHVPDDLPKLAMTSDQFKQVVLNLVRNAEQAVAEGGRIVVKGWLERGEECKDIVILEVSDNGVGIPSEILPRIFEPFFTTKRSRDGMGLGLSVTYGLVTAAGGTIHVDSREGEGTTFRVAIPAQLRDSERKE